MRSSLAQLQRGGAEVAASQRDRPARRRPAAGLDDGDAAQCMGAAAIERLRWPVKPEAGAHDRGRDRGRG